jgi:hypothetical protein
MTVDAEELAGIATLLGAAPELMMRASRTAANRTVRWARTQIARGLASRLGVAAGPVSARVKSRPGTGRPASVWIALNPLNTGKVGRESGRGIVAGREYFHRAFFAQGKFGGRAGLRRVGRSRLPLEAASVDVLGPGGEEIKVAWPAMNDRFLAEYRRELERLMHK